MGCAGSCPGGRAPSCRRIDPGGPEDGGDRCHRGQCSGSAPRLGSVQVIAGRWGTSDLGSSDPRPLRWRIGCWDFDSAHEPGAVGPQDPGCRRAGGAGWPCVLRRLGRDRPGPGACRHLGRHGLIDAPYSGLPVRVECGGRGSGFHSPGGCLAVSWGRCSSSLPPSRNAKQARHRAAASSPGRSAPSWSPAATLVEPEGRIGVGHQTGVGRHPQ